MKNLDKYPLMHKILNCKVNGKRVWKNRIQSQTQFIHLLEEAFGTEITTHTFGFYPNKIYFGTSLTSDPAYTQKMKPVWWKIKKNLEKLGWEVYAPFDKTDPHAKVPDTLNSYEIRDLDHIQVLTAEVALYDLNRPSHGVGQEIEMGVFMPKIGFSQARLSRMTKGMPGFILVNYENEKELERVLSQIFKRKSYRTEPLYLKKCEKHAAKSVYKGKICLSCEFEKYLHSV